MLFKKIISLMLQLSVLAVVALDPFVYTNLNRCTILCCLALFVLDILLNFRAENWRWTRQKWTYVAFGAMFLLVPIWQLFDSNLTFNFKFEIEHLMPFVVIGAVGLIGNNRLPKLPHFAFTMLLVSLGIVAFVFAKMDWENVHNYVDLLQVYNQFRSVSVNSHMVVVLYANVALIFGGYSLVCVPMMAWKRILLAILEMLTCMSVFLSNGRTGVATTVLIVTALVCYILWQKKRILAVVCAAVCLAIGTFGAMLNPRANVDKAVNDPRNVIWEYSCELLKNHWLFGFGASGYSVEYVQQAYAHQRMKTEFIDGCLSHPMFLGAEKDCMMIHPHNAFLKIWLQFGILGLLIFVACLVLPIVFADRKRRFFVAIIVAVFAIQSTFEPFGIHISALLYAIVILAMNNEMSKSTNLPSRQPIR